MNNFGILRSRTYGFEKITVLSDSFENIAPPVTKKEKAALSRGRIWEACFGFLLFIISSLAIGMVICFSVSLFGDETEIEKVREALPRLFLFCCGLGSIVSFFVWPLISIRKSERSLRDDLGLKINAGDIRWGLIGCACCIGAGFIGRYFWYVFVGGKDFVPNISYVNGFDKTAFVQLNVFLFVTVLASFIEEFFFRGFLLRVLLKRSSFLSAAITSSLLFGVLHVAMGSNLKECLYVFGVASTYGVIFSFLTLYREGRLGASIVAHSALKAMLLMMAW